MTSPMPRPVYIDCLARLWLPAPTFCATKDAIDCMSALGMSMAKLTILHATPYPDDASSPSRLTKAQSAKKENWVKNSCKASGSPMDKNLRHWGFSRTSARRTVKDRSFRRSMTSAQTTLTAWASTVASAAPAASRPNPATSTRSPTMLTMQATRTKISGERLSPRPRNTADNKLYATMKKIPHPQMRT